MTSIAVAPIATPKIVGKAVYLELIADPTLDPDETRRLLGWQHNGTKQVMIFPQYEDETGKIHDPVIMTRIVSSYSPRAQWDSTYVLSKPKPLSTSDDSESSSRHFSTYVTVADYTSEEWDELSEREKHDSRILATTTALGRELISVHYDWVGEGEEKERVGKATQGWVVRDSKPFSVEITDKDYDELHIERKTPQAVIRRINKVRGTLDKFPAKLA